MPYLKERIAGKFDSSAAFSRHMTERYGSGWDAGTISRLCTGRCFPRQDELWKLCLELACRPSDIYNFRELSEMVNMGWEGVQIRVDELEKELEDGTEDEE